MKMYGKRIDSEKREMKGRKGKETDENVKG